MFEKALRRLLAEPERGQVELPVASASGGVLPGVDLDDSDSAALRWRRPLAQ